MRVSEVASRYAKAVYELAKESGNQDRVLEELRLLAGAFTEDVDIRGFLESPLLKSEQRMSSLEKALTNSSVSPEVHKLLILLSKKGRLALFPEVVQAFAKVADAANGVCRGTVRSSTALAPAERIKIESIVEKVLKKKVIMTYKVDAAVIGGLVAEVGSFTFDDSLQSHLQRLNDELKRRTV